MRIHTVAASFDHTYWIRQPNGQPLPWPSGVYPTGSFASRWDDFKTIRFVHREDAEAFCLTLGVSHV